MSNFKKQFVIIKAIIVLFAPIVVGLIPTEIAFACSCVVPGTPEEEFKKFDAVFMGTVTSISERPPPDHLSEIDKAFYPKVKIGINVGQSWKGVTTDFVYVYTGYGMGDCGFQSTGFETYLFYASGPIDDLNISICSRTAWYNAAQEDRNYLKQLQEVQLTHFEPENNSGFESENNSVDNQKDDVIILLAGSTIVFFAIACYLFVKNQQIKRKIDQ